MSSNADIARAAGVSPAIVSRIVNGDKTLRVSKETRERVLRLIEEMDYAPNVAARNLKSAKTGVIALVVHDLTNSIYAEIIAGAHQAAMGFGKTILVGEANSDAFGRSHLETLVAGRGVDGLILQGADTRLDKTLARAARNNVPTVFLQSGDPDKAMIIHLDDVEAGRMATTHLTDLGHRRIGFIGVDDRLQFSKGRKTGWEQGLRAAGIAPDTGWDTIGGNQFDEGAEAISRLLGKTPDLSAVVVSSFVGAIGVLAKLQDSGKTVPHDFSVIAIHDTPLADYLRPALTVIRMPLRALGIRAVEEICAATPARSGMVVVDQIAPQIILRSSTAAPKAR
ncbi:LacI family transcriptional regulator [Rhodophyticola sp. CCM32]|uniref:LacI family DNA-binding transcriptional regulator n=1 Tax=Rhodophyticola sp. CCM32 TaxID=2916397 RepID=UPI00107FA526|nr:LacI family DNA-binding transcriptional regulator [Rhodophyticola sp. CCM32]QBY01338.1 LacI family transcriptional regulator [Rhodophyticola sp. CCM32]